MTGLHGVHATDASVGATAGTFDDINTVGDPQILVDQATRYYGYCFSGSPVAQTTNEAQSARIRLTSTSLSLVGEIFTYGAAIGAQIATNDQGAYFPVVFEPLDIKSSGAERMSSAFTTFNPDPTDAWSVVISQIHADKDQPPDAYWGWWAAGSHPPGTGGDSNGATVSLTTRTTLGTVNFEKKFLEVIGILPAATKDAVGTAGEEAVGFEEITSTLSGVQPANYPHPSIGPSLGTPVGAGIQHQLSTWLPFWIKRTAADANDRTFEVFDNLSTATTAADAYTYSLAFK